MRLERGERLAVSAGVAVVVYQGNEDADTFVKVADFRSRYAGQDLVEAGEAGA